jgi:hypothetical protein
MTEAVHICGIRHHGPGSARSLLRSLNELCPDIILLEGPPEAESVLSLASEPEMQPPVALLLYVPDAPQRAVFYPFAVFSPEWVSIQYASEKKIPLRFMDLPQSYWLARADDRHETRLAEDDDPIRKDPLGQLAAAAGFTDSERWWESLVEHRRGDDDVFAAILAGMIAVRQEIGDSPDLLELQREAYMRQTVRKAQRDGFQRIAVVCGAWHGPALISHHDAKSDSPGWYSHLWENDKQVVIRWMTQISRLMREQDLDSSPAQIIDAVRLAETLSSMRGLPLPGLRELNEAAQSVFSFGSNLQLKLIERKLIVGEKLGTVPQSTPSVPLQLDIEKTQKKLRLQPEAAQRTIDLDLRKENDLTRSHMLHRLRLLGINWGTSENARGVKGTFHEIWRLSWHPEFVISIVEAAIWGNTLVDAAEQKIIARAKESSELPILSNLLYQTLYADLPNAVEHLVNCLEEASALASDVGLLMDSFPALVNVARYGNVRKTDKSLVEHVVDRLASRILIGLPAACSSLDGDAASTMYGKIREFSAAIGVYKNDQLVSDWLDCSEGMLRNSNLCGIISGQFTRILLDSGRFDTDEVSVRLSFTLGSSLDPVKAADWIEGFLKDSAQLLILDDKLRGTLDSWLSNLGEGDFINILPLLRRTFSTFQATERNMLGQRLKAGNDINLTFGGIGQARFDPEMANAALPLLKKLLGIIVDTVAGS